MKNTLPLFILIGFIFCLPHTGFATSTRAGHTLDHYIKNARTLKEAADNVEHVFSTVETIEDFNVLSQGLVEFISTGQIKNSTGENLLAGFNGVRQNPKDTLTDERKDIVRMIAATEYAKRRYLRAEDAHGAGDASTTLTNNALTRGQSQSVSLLDLFKQQFDSHIALRGHITGAAVYTKAIEKSLGDFYGNAIPTQSHGYKYADCQDQVAGEITQALQNKGFTPPSPLSIKRSLFNTRDKSNTVFDIINSLTYGLFNQRMTRRHDISNIILALKNLPYQERQPVASLAKNYLITEIMDGSGIMALLPEISRIPLAHREQSILFAKQHVISNGMGSGDIISILRLFQGSPFDWMPIVAVAKQHLIGERMSGHDITSILWALKRLLPENRENLILFAKQHFIKNDMSGDEIASILGDLSAVPRQNREQTALSIKQHFIKEGATTAEMHEIFMIAKDTPFQEYDQLARLVVRYTRDQGTRISRTGGHDASRFLNILVKWTFPENRGDIATAYDALPTNIRNQADVYFLQNAFLILSRFTSHEGRMRVVNDVNAMNINDRNRYLQELGNRAPLFAYRLHDGDVANFYQQLDSGQTVRFNHEKIKEAKLPSVPYSQEKTPEQVIESWDALVRGVNLVDPHSQNYLSYNVISGEHSVNNQIDVQRELSRVRTFLKELYGLPLGDGEQPTWQMYEQVKPEMRKIVQAIFERLATEADASVKTNNLAMFINGLLHCPTGQKEGIETTVGILFSGRDQVASALKEQINLLVAKYKQQLLEQIVTEPHNPQNVHQRAFYKSLLGNTLGLRRVFEHFDERLYNPQNDRFGGNGITVLDLFYREFTPTNLVNYIYRHIQNEDDQQRQGRIIDQRNKIARLTQDSVEKQEAQRILNQLEEEKKQNTTYHRPIPMQEVTNWFLAEGLSSALGNEAYFKLDPTLFIPTQPTLEGVKFILKQIGYVLGE